MSVARISIGKGRAESLAQLAERFRILAEPQAVNQGLVLFTLQQDWKLYKMLKSDASHPKDTGLLKESWIPPVKIRQIDIAGTKFESTKLEDMVPSQYFSQYKSSLQNKKFNVYVLNTATVGEQARRKAGRHKQRKKKLTGRHNLKRYLKWVDARTGFYTKKLRVVRQGLDSDWKSFVREYLSMRYNIN